MCVLQNRFAKWKTNKLFGVNNEEDGAIVGVYGNKIYCTIGIDPGNLYCYNLKTQKRKKLWRMLQLRLCLVNI